MALFLYLDECLNPALAIPLQSRDVIVRTARDERTLGATDPVQLAFSASRGWVLVTHNQRHFVRLHGLRTHAGIMCVPDQPYDLTLLRLRMLIASIQDDVAHTNRLHLWRDLQAALIRGGRHPGFSEDEVRRALGQG